MSGLLLASHPRPVRDAIARHRDELQKDPATYVARERWRLEGGVLTSAAAYLGVAPTELALTDSTSMGLALLYAGLKLTENDEVLTTNHDHYALESALLVCAERTGCRITRIDMYRDVAAATAEEIVDAVRSRLTPRTRIVAITWGALGNRPQDAGAGHRRRRGRSVPASLSSGIVCFDVDRLTAAQVVAALADKGIIASRTPYRRQYARLCAGLLTPGDDVERTLAAVRSLA